jgi:5-methylcytosine-specific restriction protein A
LAEGKCQFCGGSAPFEDKEGKPYLEEHHVLQLADGGKDSIDNVMPFVRIALEKCTF